MKHVLSKRVVGVCVTENTTGFVMVEATPKVVDELTHEPVQMDRVEIVGVIVFQLSSVSGAVAM
jgi:hypothetical protein